MKTLVRNVKRYFLQAETGAALLYVALAASLLAYWMRLLVAGNAGHALSQQNPAFLYNGWTLASLAVSAWLAFLLLRRRLVERTLRRVLLVAIVHAVGAIRFYDWGLMLLAVLPLFALLAAFLLPAERRG